MKIEITSLGQSPLSQEPGILHWNPLWIQGDPVYTAGLRLHGRPPLALAQVLQPLLLAQVWQVGLESSPLLEIRGSRRGDRDDSSPLSHS